MSPTSRTSLFTHSADHAIEPAFSNFQIDRRPSKTYTMCTTGILSHFAALSSGLRPNAPKPATVFDPIDAFRFNPNGMVTQSHTDGPSKSGAIAQPVTAVNPTFP
jgi:hypothetical protein